MSVLFLIALLAGGFLHAKRRGRAAWPDVAESMLAWVLAGYCGVQVVAMGVAMLVTPERVAGAIGYPAGSPLEIWAASLMIGGGLASMYAAYRRGNALMAAVLVWGTFFLGATHAHLQVFAFHGRTPSVTAVAWILASHALVAVLLAVLGWQSRPRMLAAR
jgi:hypothetical protein